MLRAWAVRKPFCACLLLSSGTSSFSLINVTFLRFFLFCSHLLTLAPLLYCTCTCSRLDAASISLNPLFFDSHGEPFQRLGLVLFCFVQSPHLSSSCSPPQPRSCNRGLYTAASSLFCAPFALDTTPSLAQTLSQTRRLQRPRHTGLT
ncbi:hypothetical protein V8C44DRAFT_264603 [Trichoderma aethiopicum]